MSSEAEKDLFVGVDGGGTKTAVCVVSSTGEVVSRVQSSSSNPNSVGEAGAKQAVQDAIKQAVQEAGGSLSSVRSVVLSMSGCNSDSDARRMEGWLADSFPSSTTTSSSSSSPSDSQSSSSQSHTSIHAFNDSVAALVSGTSGTLDGLVVIAGTGMISKGIRADTKQNWTTGGNGALIDPGSGYQIGLAVLRAAFSAHDGMGPPTPLLEASLAFLGKTRSEELVDWLYADYSWARIGTLAPLAFLYSSVHTPDSPMPAAAPGFTLPPPPTKPEEIDPVSVKIIESNAEYLVRSLEACEKKLNFHQRGDGDVTVVCAGGMLQNPHLFRLVQSGVHRFLPRAKLVHPTVSPSEGAALLARKMWMDEQTDKKEQTK